MTMRGRHGSAAFGSRTAALLALAAVAAAALACAGRRPPEEREAFRRVNPQVAFLILRDTPDLMVLDLRRREEFNGPRGHLAGAKNIPLDELPERVIELGVHRHGTFLVYCRGGDDCGERGMEILLARGCEDALLMDGGLAGWVEAGYGAAGDGGG